MAVSLGSLLIDIGMRTASLNNDLNKVGRSIDRNSRKWERRFQGVSKAFGGIFAGLSVAGLASATREVTRFADTLANTADRVGVSVESVQALRLEAEKVGLSFSQTDTALQRFSRRIAEAQQGTGQLGKVFKQYGVSLKDSAGNFKDVNALLEEFRTVLSGIESPAERNRVAMAAFDTEGVKLGQTLAGINGTIDETTQTLIEQGRVIREDSIRAAAELEAQWTETSQKMAAVTQKSILYIICNFQKMWNYLSQGMAAFAEDLGIVGSISDEVNKVSREISGLKERRNDWTSFFRTSDEQKEWERRTDEAIARLKKLREAAAGQFVADRYPKPPQLGVPGVGTGGTGGKAGTGGGGSSSAKAIREIKRQYDEVTASLKRVTEEANKLQEFAKTTTLPQEEFDRFLATARQLADEEERLTGEQQALSEKLASVGVDATTATDKLNEMLDGVSEYRRGLKGVDKVQADVAKSAEQLWTEAGNSIGSALSRMVEGTAKARDVIKSLVADITKMLAKQAIASFFSSATPAAHGLAFPGGMSLGQGVYNSPHLFKFARGGRLGLLGEAGAEAVLPLTRLSGGDLGVKAQAARQEVIINNYSGAPARETRRQLSDREIVEITIGEVQSAIGRGGNALSRSFETSYGLRRGR